MIGLLENKAENSGIDRFNIYSFEELLSLVKNKKESIRSDIESELNTIQKILEIFNKEEVLQDASDIIFLGLEGFGGWDLLNIEYIQEQLRKRVPKPIEEMAEFAVLIPLIYNKGQWEVIYELRAKGMKSQPGELSFPGGSQ